MIRSENNVKSKQVEEVEVTHTVGKLNNTWENLDLSFVNIKQLFS